jgi:hypothetical protein
MPTLLLAVAIGAASGQPEVRLRLFDLSVAKDESAELYKKLARDFIAAQKGMKERRAQTIADRTQMIADLTASISRLEERLEGLRKDGAGEDNAGVKNLKLAIDTFTRHRQMFESLEPKKN